MKQEIDYEKLGLRIKEVRQSRKLTQDTLAEMVHCNTSHISNIENNHTKVSLNVLLAIANALDTSIDCLLLERYDNAALPIENEILKEVRKYDDSTKENVLKIMQLTHEVFHNYAGKDLHKQ